MPRKILLAFIVGLLLILIETLLPSIKSTVLQSREKPNWQTSQSVAGVRLGIREKDGVFESYDAVFIVTNSNGKEFGATKRVEQSMIEFVQFPNDFGGYAPNDNYRWICVVNDKAVVEGKFDYSYNYISIDDDALKFLPYNGR